MSHRNVWIQIGLVSLSLVINSTLLYNNLISKEISLRIYYLIYAWIGWKIWVDTIRQLINGFALTEYLLMASASLAAVMIGEALEGIMVLLLFRVGETLEGMAVASSERAIEAALAMRPKTVRVLQSNGSETQIVPEEVPIGSTIRILPGETLAIDGEVVTGKGFISTASLTGESAPEPVQVGSLLRSGISSLDTTLMIRTNTAFANGTLAQLIQLIQNASLYKSKSERFMTRFAQRYTPTVFVITLLLFFIPTALQGFTAANVSFWGHKAIAFLIISCPCALVLSIPLTFFSSIGSAARQGILIRSSQILENIAKVRCVAFDKTGTLTKGSFEVAEFQSDAPERASLWIRSLQKDSTHPIARALTQYAGPGEMIPVDHSQEISGKGILATVGSKEIRIGNDQLIEEAGITPTPSSHTGSKVNVTEDGSILAVVYLEDSLRPESHQTVQQLQSLGITTCMFTGDRDAAAQTIATQVGIQDVYSQLLPEDKLNLLLEKKVNETTLFIGDGINDAAVLRAADVGVSFGQGGSDLAVESADIVLMRDNLSSLPTLLRLSKKARRILFQNISMALGIKFVVMGANIFLTIPLVLAIFADVGVTLLTVLNSIRIFRRATADAHTMVSAEMKRA